ncbi:MAG TPA: hypothetical protein PLX58_05615 [Smithellaceae bacterium]|nr:hypothetical protein [Smithellaceae bacterium]HQF84432.1 hypothetical protein [Smithellaceae bacterium]HQG81567.1 hypothetical protein [Smithellaceae bacterium]
MNRMANCGEDNNYGQKEKSYYKATKIVDDRGIESLNVMEV